MPPLSDILIAGRPVGPDHPPYVIAEMSGNHNHDFDRAKKLIDAAKEAGADAVKLQTYTADTITIQSDRPEFVVNEGLWKGRSLYELYEEAHTPWEWHAPLFEYAKDIGVAMFSSAFDETAIDLLEGLGAPAYKIASAEIVDWGLLEAVARTGKPVIVSTGMATDDEITDAVRVLREAGAKDIIVLHCISAYPTEVEDLNLRRIAYLEGKLGVHVGLSDHSMGVMGGVCAALAGAAVLEKHFTLNRADGGVDSAFSLNKEELAELCQKVREAHAALGDASNQLTKTEEGTRQFRRSLYFVKPLGKGEEITRDHIRSIRPGAGLLPRHLNELIGRKATADIASGTPTDWSLVE